MEKLEKYRLCSKGVLTLVFGCGLQPLHGTVEGDLRLIVLVHTLLVLQALFGADAGGLGAVLVDVLGLLALSTSKSTKVGVTSAMPSPTRISRVSPSTVNLSIPMWMATSTGL